MPVRVVLEPGCCPAGSGTAARVRDGGGKAVEVGARPAAAGHEHGHGPDEQYVDEAVGVAWGARLAPVLGLHRDVVAAGLPVPLAAELTLWEAVAGHVDDARADAVVVHAAPAAVLAGLDAPALAVRVLDARLDALAPLAAEEPAAASQLQEALDLRRAAGRLVSTAAGAAVTGEWSAHRGHGCRADLLGVARVATADPLGEVVPGWGVRPDGGRFVWWCSLAHTGTPVLETDGTVLHVTGPGGSRAFPLPAALARCTVDGAEVVDAAGDRAPRLQVSLRPDPTLWR